jgi:hypothetical protein
LYNDRFLNYDHYKNVIDSGAVTILKTKGISEQINETLANPACWSSIQRKGLVSMQISGIEGTSKRIVIC